MTLTALIASAVLLSACASARTGSDAERSSAGVPATPTVAAAAGTATRTGERALDAFLHQLETHDVESLLAAVRYIPTPCTPQGSEGVPACPAGTPADGASLVPVFRVESCKPIFPSRPDETREWFDRVFAGSAASSVYSSVRRTESKGGALFTYVIIGAGDAPSRSARGSLWILDKDDRLVRLYVPCDERATTSDIAKVYGMQGPTIGGYLIWPQVACDAGQVDVRLRVEGVFRERHPKAILGAIMDANDQPTGEGEVVIVQERDPATGEISPPAPGQTPEARVPEYLGLLSGLSNVVNGIRITVTGWQFGNCNIEAWSIERD